MRTAEGQQRVACGRSFRRVSNNLRQQADREAPLGGVVVEARDDLGGQRRLRLFDRSEEVLGAGAVG
jgi:hypothetical protein